MYFFCFLSDKRLALKNFARSKSLPYPQDYNTVGNNPKLSCLLDQMKADQELSEKYPSQQALLNEIISALETEIINWPSTFNLMSSEQWIQKMRANPKFYFHHAKTSSEMREYENLLLDLAAQCLKSEIQLIPFFEEDEILTFGSYKTWFSRLKKIFVTVKPTTCSRLFSIMACQTLSEENFFLSIKKEQHTPE